MKRWRDESEEADFWLRWSDPLWRLALWALLSLAGFALGVWIAG